MATDPNAHGSPDEQTDTPTNQTHPQSQTLPHMSDSIQDRSQSDDKASPASASSTKDQNDSTTKRSNAKDPSRPRRKKARRACYACQRAHLTCGDERPCLRCIKRGLQDHCHDGVRKKAKYLHDAPNEALMSHTYNQNQNQAQMGQSTPATEPTPVAQSSSYFATPVGPQAFANFGHTPSSAPINSPSTTDSPMIHTNPYAPQQNMVTQPFPSASQQMPPPQDPVSSIAHTSPDAKPNQPFNAPFFDPADPSLFNFDISSLNFGNHYGALEFGMLGHMSSGAVETPDTENNNLMTSIPYDPTNSNYSNTYPYNSSTFTDWQRNADGARQNSSGQIFSITGDSSFDGQLNFPNAFAIGENGSISGASPSAANMMDFGTGYNSSPVASAQHLLQNPNQDYNRHPQRPSIRNSFSANDIHQTRPNQQRRRRDPSDIYTSVTAPYSYTTGFHALTACLQRLYSPQKTARIARALAAIRPSFISCTKQLNVDDLIFMEKCFQRTLFEYDDFLTAYGTPTLILRRTGEVAAVSKEFSLLTGWSRDVLLGKDANLNINIGNASGRQTGTSTRGTATPRAQSSGDTAGRLQPVLLPELMEDDNVIDFYEDFAKLAFGDSRGVMMKPCKLLKYKTKEDPGWSADLLSERENRHSNGRPVGPLISAESGMNSLGDRDGKVSCMFCWVVKRDVFDIPMMIVMNVSLRILSSSIERDVLTTSSSFLLSKSQGISFGWMAFPMGLALGKQDCMRT
ncbi:hypothetical protein D6C99_03770 [Aureobasidium pullulans]|nr:hypothetical protein D6C99_03770 [Aureobasidium pullulans]TIA46710.1 hypothetical protein D6C79_05050 [Aureobasidium pullulans]